MDRIAPTRRPDRRVAGYQKWRALSFLHWRVPAEVLRPLVPARLALDAFDDAYYVGLVPFTMRGVRPWWAPPVPGVSSFHETNVRTYVHLDGRDPGVWFFSLDAANRLAVWAARTGWSLPYHHARMTVEGGSYASVRRADGASCRVTTRAVSEPAAAEPGTLEHFLAERYVLYAEKDRRLYLGRVHHTPYPLQRAEVIACEETLLAAAGIARGDEAPIAHCAAGVDVEVFALEGVP